MSRHLVLLLALQVLTLSAWAQLDPSQVPVSIGPMGNVSFGSVAVDPLEPDRILVVENGVLRRSVDGGKSFTPLLAPSFAGPLHHVAADPRVPMGAFLLGGDSVHASTDFGATWSAPVVVAAGVDLLGIALPAAGTHLLIWDATELFRSVDGGATWSVVLSTAGGIRAAAYAPGDAARLYVFRSSTQNHSRYVSHDGGDSFSEFQAIGSIPGGRIAVDPLDPDRVVYNYWSAYYVVSHDAGATTQPFPVPAGAGSLSGDSITAFAPDGSRLWVGGSVELFSTTDSGLTWEQSIPCPWSPGTGEVYAYRDIVFDSLGRLYTTAAGWDCGGLFRSTAASPPTSWDHLASPGHSTRAVAIAAPGGTRVTGTQGHERDVWVAPPHATFERATATIPGLLLYADFDAPLAIAIDPHDPHRWALSYSSFGCSSFLPSCGGDVTVYGVRAGETAVDELYFESFGIDIFSGLYGVATLAFAFDPAVPDRMLVARQGPGPIGQPLPSWVETSSDDGSAWTPALGDPGAGIRALAFDPLVPDRVITLGRRNGSILSESLDGGLTWSGPLYPCGACPTEPHRIEFDPFEAGVLWAGSAIDGLWRSLDGGVTWQPLGISLDAQSDLLVHPEIPGLLWVSNDLGEVLVSKNWGTSFELASGVTDQAGARGLALDTLDGTLVFCTEGDSCWEIDGASPFVVRGEGTPGTGGVAPLHVPLGGFPHVGNSSFHLGGDRLVGGGVAIPLLGVGEVQIPALGGTWYVDLFTLPWLALPLVTADGALGQGGAGEFVLSLPIPPNPSLVGEQVFTQCLVIDPGAADPSGLVLTAALRTTILP